MPRFFAIPCTGIVEPTDVWCDRCQKCPSLEVSPLPYLSRMPSGRLLSASVALWGAHGPHNPGDRLYYPAEIEVAIALVAYEAEQPMFTNRSASRRETPPGVSPTSPLMNKTITVSLATSVVGDQLTLCPSIVIQLGLQLCDGRTTVHPTSILVTVHEFVCPSEDELDQLILLTHLQQALKAKRGQAP